MRTLIQRINGVFGRVPEDFTALALRFFPAMVFWQSGQTKVDGFSIKDSTWFLFETEFAFPIVPSSLAAVLATLGEHILPVLMIIGLFSRASAFGLLVIGLPPEKWSSLK